MFALQSPLDSTKKKSKKNFIASKMAPRKNKVHKVRKSTSVATTVSTSNERQPAQERLFSSVQSQEKLIKPSTKKYRLNVLSSTNKTEGEMLKKIPPRQEEMTEARRLVATSSPSSGCARAAAADNVAKSTVKGKGLQSFHSYFLACMKGYSKEKIRLLAKLENKSSL